MTFTPYHTKIEFLPAKRDTILGGGDEKLEMGEVVAVGRDVVGIEPGDTIFFVKWGVFETPEVDGTTHFVVEASPEFILGYAKREQV